MEALNLIVALAAVASSGLLAPAQFEAACVESAASGSEWQIAWPGYHGRVTVYVPEDYTPVGAWPVIAYYHGYSDRLGPNTRIMRAVTGGIGFIIIGMDYGNARYYETLDRGHLRAERRRLREILELVKTCLSINRDALFIGGYSQGGYASANLGERMLDEVAGIILLGAGRGCPKSTAPSPRLLSQG